MINDEEKELEDVESISEEYEEKFRLMDEFELYFHATGYEDYGDDYSYWRGKSGIF